MTTPMRAMQTAFSRSGIQAMSVSSMALIFITGHRSLMARRYSPGETADVNATDVSTCRRAGLEGTPGVGNTLTAAEWDKAIKDLYTLLYLTVGEAGDAPAGLMRNFILKALTDGDGQRAWLALMDKNKYESKETLRTAIRKFISLGDSEDLDTLFFEADDFREEVKHHGETISDRAYKG